jgi:hypothetical protein
MVLRIAQAFETATPHINNRPPEPDA